MIYVHFRFLVNFRRQFIHQTADILIAILFALVVESLVYFRSFCLLIRVSIYQNVHLSEWISKMVVANFLKHNEGRGQRSKVIDSTILGTCIMV